jgi:mannose-6-phosphate isomerase-like protein (cupin superfamily)
MTDGYVADVKKAAKDNDDFRRVLFTTPKSQLVLMSLEPGEEIGMEVHDGDQVIYIVDGEGLAVLEETEHEIDKGSIVFVPAGVRHNIVSDEEETMKLFTIYTPPQHAAGVVERTKGDAQAAADEAEAGAELAAVDAM